MSSACEAAIDAALGRLSHQDRERILRNIIWEAFGDIDEAGERAILPGRAFNEQDARELIAGLRDELWPPTEDGPVYPGATEVVPGVFVSYELVAIFDDGAGEVAYWSRDEWVDDPSVVAVITNAVAMAAANGAEAVRRNIADSGETLRKLVNETARRRSPPV